MEDVRRAIQIVEFIRGNDLTTRKMVQDWSRSNDPDVIGAAYVAVSKHAQRIQDLRLRDIGDLTLKVFAIGLRYRGATDYGFDPPDSNVVLLRFLIQCVRADPTHQDARRALRAVVMGLRGLYKRSRSQERQRIVQGILEHAFECPDLRRQFKSWAHDRVLKKAHREAAMWADKIGDDGVLAQWQAAGVLPQCCPDAPHRR
jgi:hypothetical protein